MYSFQGQSIVAWLFCKFSYRLYLVNVHCFCTLPGRPRQGPLSVLGKAFPASLPQKNTRFRCTYGVDKDDFCIMQIFTWIPSLFEHKVHQNVICTSYKRYCIHIKKKFTIGLKTLLQSRCFNLVLQQSTKFHMHNKLWLSRMSPSWLWCVTVGSCLVK